MAEKTCTYKEFGEEWEKLEEQVRFKLASHNLSMFCIQVVERPMFTRRDSGMAAVNWDGCGSRTTNDAREFAIALAEVADLVDRFKYNGYKIGD